MAEDVRSVMTKDPATLPPGATASEAAKLMRDLNIGTVILTEGDQIRGIVTDRDLVVRCLAAGEDPSAMTLGDVCTKSPLSLKPSDRLENAIHLMGERAVRRLPVVEHGKPVGIVSLGDLAQARDRRSALGRISSAPPS